jgi:hypothetical protein
LRRIQDEDSDQEPEDETLRREVIAENLFATGSDDVSNNFWHFCKQFQALFILRANIY